MKLNRFYVYAFALLAMLFWGFSYIWVKIAYKYYDPITVVFLRLLFSSLILIFVVRFFRKRRRIERKDLKYFLLLSFFEPFCYFLSESHGIKLVSPTIAAVIIATIPVFTPVAALLFLREKIKWLNVVGLIISFIGVLFIVLKNDLSFAASPAGVGLMFLAVLSTVGFVVYIKKLTNKYSVVTIITAQNIIGAIYILPLFLILDFEDFIQVAPNFELITTLGKLVVFSSILAFLFFIVVIRELGATRANIFSNFIPVVTAIFSYFLLQEEFNTGKIIGTALVIGGVLLTQVTRLKTFKKAFTHYFRG